LPHETFGVVG